MFESVQPAPPDPILGLTEAFKADPRPEKVNLGVGVYKDDGGQTPVLQCVKAAEAAILAAETSKTYLPITGDPAYGQLVQELVFGADAAGAAPGLCTAQTPGGTGALRVGAEFYRAVAPSASAWLSTPTWPNHRGVFSAAGFDVKDYPYYDAATRAADAGAMLDALKKVPAGDLVVLHACCHNPTGADLEPAHWEAVAAAAKAGGWIPFIDCAYAGFGDGLEPDTAPLRILLQAGPDFMAAVSFSKNMGLYSERVGALVLSARDRAAAQAAFSRVKRAIRVLYSNPSSHGGRIVERVLGEAEVRDLWIRELAAMRERIHAIRAGLVQGLEQRGAQLDLSAIARQRGMFSLTGLTPAQIDYLRDQKAVYVVGDSRVNVAGLTSQNLDYVCDALVEALAKA